MIMCVCCYARVVRDLVHLPFRKAPPLWKGKDRPSSVVSLQLSTICALSSAIVSLVRLFASLHSFSLFLVKRSSNVGLVYDGEDLSPAHEPGCVSVSIRSKKYVRGIDRWLLGGEKRG